MLQGACTDGATPIFVAAQKNHIEIVKIRMKATDNPNAAMNNGSTPIHSNTNKSRNCAIIRELSIFANDAQKGKRNKEYFFSIKSK